MLCELVAMTMLLLFMNVAIAALPPRAASSPADTIIHGPTFRYMLKKDQNAEICKHMLHVFNDKFTHLWDAPPLTSLTKDPNYSATGKYAFPLLPGVKHSPKATFEMRFSAWPTSPEFAAIRWREGRAVFGGCPTGKKCAGEGPIPILVAHFDFDNDRSIDTVIQWAFDSGESSPEGALNVWRGKVLKITGMPVLWALDHPQDKRLTPIMMRGEYPRPFICRGVVYVAKYKPDFGSESKRPPFGDTAAPGPRRHARRAVPFRGPEGSDWAARMVW